MSKYKRKRKDIIADTAKGLEQLRQDLVKYEYGSRLYQETLGMIWSMRALLYELKEEK